jgi:hypothetical protein
MALNRALQVSYGWAALQAYGWLASYTVCQEYVTAAS